MSEASLSVTKQLLSFIFWEECSLRAFCFAISRRYLKYLPLSFRQFALLFSALKWSGRSDRMRAMERVLKRVLIESFVSKESATPTPAQVATLRATSQFGQKLMPFFNTYSSNRSLNLLRAELQTRIFTNINSLCLIFIFGCYVCTFIWNFVSWASILQNQRTSGKCNRHC